MEDVEEALVAPISQSLLRLPLNIKLAYNLANRDLAIECRRSRVRLCVTPTLPARDA